MRRRDPVKQAIYLGVFLVVLSLVWFSSIWVTYVISRNTLASLQGDIQAHTNQFAEVQGNLKKTAENQKRMEALQKYSNARFFQGTVLNALQQCYAPNVQLTRLRVDQDYTIKAGSPAQTNSFGVVPGKPGTSTEKILLTLEAKDYSPNPGDQVNRFKEVVTKQSYFKSALIPTNGVRLASTPSVSQTAQGDKPSVHFTLECRFSDKTR